MQRHNFDVFLNIFSDPEVSLPIVSRRSFADLNDVMNSPGTAGLFACADASTEFVYNLQTQESIAFSIMWGRYENYLWGRNEGQNSLSRFHSPDLKLRKVTSGNESCTLTRVSFQLEATLRSRPSGILFYSARIKVSLHGIYFRADTGEAPVLDSGRDQIQKFLLHLNS